MELLKNQDGKYIIYYGIDRNISSIKDYIEHLKSSIYDRKNKFRMKEALESLLLRGADLSIEEYEEDDLLAFVKKRIVCGNLSEDEILKIIDPKISIEDVMNAKTPPTEQFKFNPGINYQGPGDDYSKYVAVNYNGRERVFCIPDTYDGKPVTRVYGFSTFDRPAARYMGVKIPDSVEIISECFSYNEDIQVVCMGKGVLRVGRDSFEKCPKLHTVVFGPMVQEVEEYAFRESGVKNIYMPPSVKEISDMAFGYNDDSVTVFGKLGTYAEKFAKQRGYKFQVTDMYDAYDKLYSIQEYVINYRKVLDARKERVFSSLIDEKIKGLIIKALEMLGYGEIPERISLTNLYEIMKVVTASIEDPKKQEKAEEELTPEEKLLKRILDIKKEMDVAYIFEGLMSASADYFGNTESREKTSK